MTSKAYYLDWFYFFLDQSIYVTEIKHFHSMYSLDLRFNSHFNFLLSKKWFET